MGLWEKSGIAFLLALIFAIAGCVGFQLWWGETIAIDDQVKVVPPPSWLDEPMNRKACYWGWNLFFGLAIGSALFSLSCVGLLLVRWTNKVRHRLPSNSSIE